MRKLQYLVATAVYLVMMMSVAPLAQGEDYIRLTDIEASEDAQSVLIKLTSSRPLRTIAYDVKKPPQIILDMLDAAKTELPQELAVGKGQVVRVRFVRDTGKKMEGEGAAAYPVDFLVIELKSMMPYSSTEEGGLSIVTISKHKELQEAPHPVTPAAAAPTDSPLKLSLKEEIARAREETHKVRGAKENEGYEDEEDEEMRKEMPWYKSFKRPEVRLKSEEEVTISKLEGKEEALKQEIDRIQRKRSGLKKKVVRQKEKRPEIEKEKTWWEVTAEETGKFVKKIWADVGDEEAMTDNVMRLVGREKRGPNIWAKSLRDKGYMFQEKGEFEKAAELYRQAAKLDPEYAGIHNDLGVVYEQMGLDEKAIDEYTAALVIDPHYLSAHTNLAMLYEKRGDAGKARFHWKKRAYLGARNDPWTQRAREKIRRKKR